MSDIVTTEPVNLRTYLLWGLLFSLLIIPFVIAIAFMFIHEGDASRPYEPELRKIAAETPVYAEAQKIGEKVVFKREMAYLFASYRSNVSFVQIDSFYKQELPKRGWALFKGPTNRFVDTDPHSQHYRRGAYSIAVEPLSDGFQVVFMWNLE